MAFLPSLRQLFIPRKGSNAVPDLDADWRAIETWAKNVVVQLTAGSGVTLNPSDGFGPVVEISASGGGGGITDITNGGGMTITNPTGPTVNIAIRGLPFLNTSEYADVNESVAYGDGALAAGAGSVGSGNTAVGYQAMLTSSTGDFNVAVGWLAGSSIVSGSDNTLVGYEAMSGGDNIECTAVGFKSLLVASGTTENVAVGAQSLSSVTSGSNNVSVGTGAGNHVTTGSENTSIGDGAGVTSGDGTISNTTSVGAGANVGAAGGVAIGRDHSGTAAIATNQDDFVLGTSNHVVNFLNNHTGTTTTTLGTNGPSVSTTPTTWVKVRLNSGSIGYIPVWV